jgi:RnfABCDGE-type electron transport complex D subunit
LKNTVKDLSAVLTGLLLALNLPPEVPFWIPIIGGFFAIIVVKQLFGGLGQNFMNPALGARCFLLISFTGRMTSFTYDAVTTATPLANLKAGESVDVLSMFLGKTAGTIGETCSLALIFGGIFLIVRGIVNYRIPVFYIGSFAVFIMVYAVATGKGLDFTYLAAHLFGGGLMLGAFFMATDYVTSPITPMGKVIFGILLGFLTFLFRIYGGSAEGVSYAIIIGNLLVPLIERVTVPKSFGKGAVKHE